jgi:hypothetical protein
VGATAGAPVGSGPPRRGAAWAAPLARADEVWTRFETWLVVLALALEISSMSLWVFLKGLSTPAGGESRAGVVFRAVVGATVLGMALYLGMKKSKPSLRRAATLGGVFLGLLLGKAWAAFGVDYTSNLLNWYQQACFLTLLGGLRGVGTRLTLLLAMLGGSLATARGKHIIIDIATRFVGYRARLTMVVAGWLVSAVVSAAAAWGFFDHIAIQSFGAQSDARTSQKIGHVLDQLGEDFFIVRKQIGLDFKSTPHILFKGEKYADWLKGKEWNRWLDGSGLVERYGEEQVRALRIADNDTRAPLIVIPGRGEPRGELIDAANLVFPIGLLVIAIRFVVRVLLVVSGHARIDEEESGEFPAGEPSKARA